MTCKTSYCLAMLGPTKKCSKRLHHGAVDVTNLPSGRTIVLQASQSSVERAMIERPVLVKHAKKKSLMMLRNKFTSRAK